jgi:hypothetical protein
LLGAIPTQEQLAGNLAGMAVRDPFTKQPFPNAQIPASMIDRTTASFKQFVPATTNPLGTYGRGLNYTNAVSSLSNWD